MNPLTIQDLYFGLYDKSNPRNPRLFVETFEKNAVLIMNADLTNRDEYEYVMWLTSDYAIQLESLGYLKKSLEFFDKAIHLFENHPTYGKDKLFELQYYELLKFHQARALYNLKRYKASLSIFQELDKAFPKNDRYEGWVKGVRYKSIERFTWNAFGITLIIYFLRMPIEGKNASLERFSFWMFTVAYLFFMICLLMNVIMRIKDRKYLRGNKGVSS